MVRNLYLLRHGHAEHGYNIKDFDRQLTSTGTADVGALGARLKDEGLQLDIVFCSPARRTTETAEIVTGRIGFQKAIDFVDEIYEASVKQLLDVVSSASVNHENVMLIGHNPSISFLNDYLAEEHLGTLAPGDISKISFQDQSWQEITKGSGKYQEI